MLRRARLQHVHGRQVAPDAERAGDARPGPYDRWPLGPRLRALLRLPRRRHQPVVSRPRLRQPPGRAAEDARGGLPPERGPGRQGDRVHRRREAGRPRTSRSSCTSASARRTRRTTSPKEWADKYAGAFDDGWDAYREKVFARQKELGIVPADAELSRHDPDVPEWDSLPAPDARRLYSRMMEVFAGLPRATPTTRSGGCSTSCERSGELDNTLIMVISDNGASAEGGPTGTINEAQFFNNAPEPLEDSLAAHRRDRRPEALQPLPVGLDVGRQHAVPPLEAGDLPRRRRPTRSSCHWPKGIKATRRGAHAVRAHHRHGADRARRCSASSRRRRSAASRSRRCTASASRTPSTTPTPRAGTHTQYFEMLGHRAIYHDGWRAVCPWPGPSFTEAGMGVRPADLRRDARPSSTPTAGSSTTWPRTSRRTTTSPPSNRDRLIAMIGDLVRRGRQVQRACRSTAAASPGWSARSR